jgi:large subunit ribosomal protein L10
MAQAAVKISAKQQMRIAEVEELKAKLREARGLIVTDYRGLTVAEITELRRELRKVSVEYRVVKNTLAALATQELGIPELHPHLVGPTAVAIGYGDLVAATKVLSTFAKNTPALQIKAGLVDGRVLQKEEVVAIADLPSREVLRARIVGALQAPLTTLMGLLATPLRELAYVLEARGKGSGAD